MKSNETDEIIEFSLSLSPEERLCYHRRMLKFITSLMNKNAIKINIYLRTGGLDKIISEIKQEKK